MNLFCDGSFDSIKDFSALLLRGTVNGIPYNALLVDYYCEGKALGTNPWHHGLIFNKMNPVKLTLVGDTFRGSGIMKCCRKEQYFWQQLFPFRKNRHFS